MTTPADMVNSAATSMALGIGESPGTDARSRREHGVYDAVEETRRRHRVVAVVRHRGKKTDPPRAMPWVLLFGPFGGAVWPLNASPETNPKRVGSGEQKCIGSSRGQRRPLHDPEDIAREPWPWASGTGGGGAF